ncbi:type II DNA topoisomerase [Cristinia sonorae]|uniref:DNA topoisomerase 2 n=1 Tax=Cristinia sonorae TaxID=1940300 RepID=A0A8K0UR45_9AGAR|nr:type II DNA topoisomerase [Cristinia sonorae]
MSSSEGERFDMDVSGSESEDYAPAPKKKAPAKPKAAPKATKPAAAAKPKAAPKKKVLVEKDENGNDSDVNYFPEEPEAGPSEPAAAGPAKKKTASETYQKLTQLEHILKRPDSYIGSVESITAPMWVWDSDNKRMVLREIKYVPGFFKIVDEILVNAADNKINDPNMDTLKVTVDPENNTISVYNNGRGIPIEMHSREKIYIPELIFGHLLSSSNYDDDEKKLTGGRNGYGAKLANIYSTQFTVETADKNSSQKYSQTWTDNMSKMGKAKITKNGKGEEYTRVTFKPDLKRFGMDSIDDDTVALLKKRVYDMAGTVKDVKVVLNDERLKVKGFKQYVELYLNSAAEQAQSTSGGAAQAKQSVIYEQVGKRWEVAFAVSDGSFQHVSFANSIATTKGGTHVNAIADQISKNLITSITKKNKGATVKPAQIRTHMWIFVNALIENPTFDSQTKETLTLPASKFGTRPTLSDDFHKKVAKSPIVEEVLSWAKNRAERELKKTDGNRRNRITGLPKLSDANNAGTRKAADCTLILTEGDSAKCLAVAGLAVLGRDNYGVFPLRGKLLNVRDAKHDQIMKNEEIQNIKKILGLQHNKDYKDVSTLRYGSIMIMTDQDHDGSHIKGLILNYLDHFYPSLLKIPKFLVEFVTPIVRVKKGTQVIDFYTIPEYEAWVERTHDSHRWTAKYYKGLGTSEDTDAFKYFGQIGKHMIPFSTMKDEERELLELAFSKKKADDRKEWLRQLKPGTFLDHTVKEITVTNFIHNELILFSMADNIRSIPSVADGLKPGQRKIIWGCFKRKLKGEIKVAQLAGYISEKSAYQHGEQSLQMTIVNLAQDYVGSNNVNLLMPHGQYGTRDQGGKDHASARYIFTQPAPIARALFHPADDPLLTYLTDDSTPIEPEWYLPTVPLVLINGAEGIGTGWSTNIPCFNPVDIVANIRRLMNGQEQEKMLPWWRGFKGNIKKIGEHKYDVTGIANKIDDTNVEIIELPIHRWTQGYKMELEAMCGEKGDGPVKDYKEYHDNVNVHFLVTMTEAGMKKAEEQGFIEFFKLSSKVNTSNMMCFDFDNKIKKYDSPEDIIEEFYPVRLAYYQKRKDFMSNELQNQLEKLSNQARFIQMIVDKELIISGRKKVDVVADLKKKDFRPFPKVKKIKTVGESEENQDEEEEEEASSGVTSDYDYLLNMSISNLTREKIDRLKQQAKDKEAELLTLLGRKPVEIWNEDLDNFLVEWENSCRNWEKKTVVPGTVAKKSKRKQPTLAAAMRKKVKDEDGDEGSDDDFKPTKAAAKKKATSDDAKPKSTKKATASKVEDDEDTKVPPAPSKKATAAQKKKAATKQEDDDDEDDFVLERPMARAATKRAIKADSDSDVEMVDDPPVKKAGPADELEDSNLDSKPVVKDKGKGKAAPKRTSLDVEEDDSDDDIYMKPAAKKQKLEDGSTASGSQKSVTDFFDKVPAKKAGAGAGATARKASGAAAKPTATKKKKAPASDDDGQSDSDVPVGKKPVATARKASGSKPAPKKKAVDLSDDEMAANKDSDDDIPPPPPKRNEAPPRRAAAAKANAKKYIEIVSSEEDGGGDEGGSDFDDFD